MAKLILLPRAEADLFDIWRSISEKNPRAADEVIRRIMEKATRASDHPLIGVARPELSSTARILIEGRYIAIYEPHDDGITVIAIVHGMRDRQSWLD